MSLNRATVYICRRKHITKWLLLPIMTEAYVLQNPVFDEAAISSNGGIIL